MLKLEPQTKLSMHSFSKTYFSTTKISANFLCCNLKRSKWASKRKKGTKLLPYSLHDMTSKWEHKKYEICTSWQSIVPALNWNRFVLYVNRWNHVTFARKWVLPIEVCHLNYSNPNFKPTKDNGIGENMGIGDSPCAHKHMMQITTSNGSHSNDMYQF